MFKTHILTILVVCATLFSCTDNNQNIEQRITEEAKPLKVTLSPNLPGHVIIGGEVYGYFYELLKLYAKENNYEIELSIDESVANMLTSIKNNTTNIGLSLTSTIAKKTISLPLYSTKYVLLGNKASKTITNIKDLANKIGNSSIMISSSFENSKSYDIILDSLTQARIYASSKNSYELVEGIIKKDYDFLICEKSEALIAQQFIKDIKCLYEFDEPIDISLIFSDETESIYKDFSQWFALFSNSEDHKQLRNTYLNRGFKQLSQTMRQQNMVVDGISVWDNLLKEVGAKEGVDWRLLSAIAYKESRFRHNITSSMGARGLMQVMPVTARHFNIPASALSDPKINISVAAKLLKNIEQTLNFGAETNSDDKLNITLAAYNSGLGTVSNARRLAISEDKNPDSWSVIAKYLALMGDENYQSDTVTFRKFTGSKQTCKFVAGVSKRYETYCSTIK